MNTRLPLIRPLRLSDYPFVHALPKRPDAGLEQRRAALVDDFGDLASESFDPARVHPLIRRFYETKSPPRMTIDWLRWENWAQPMAFGYVPMARKLGNLCVPDRIDTPTRVSSHVNPWTLADGSQSRCWRRNFTGTNQLFYSASFRPWCDPAGAASYVSMAFAYPKGQLLVMMQLRNEGAGLSMSTRGSAPCGTYAVVSGTRHFTAFPGPPTDEVLTFHAQGDVIEAVHEDFIGQRRTFAMQYRIEP